MIVERRWGESLDQRRAAIATLVRLQLVEDLVPKQSGLLKVLVPNLSRIASLAVPNMGDRYDQQAAVGARTLRLELHPLIVREAGDIATAFRGHHRTRGQASDCHDLSRASLCSGRWPHVLRCKQS